MQLVLITSLIFFLYFVLQFPVVCVDFLSGRKTVIVLRSTAQGKFKGHTVQHAFITHENMQPREVKRFKQDQTAVPE